MKKIAPLVTIKAYAEYWKLHRNTVTNLIERGEITVFETPKGKHFLNLHERPSKETLARTSDK